jgi:hypothetical protein
MFRRLAKMGVVAAAIVAALAGVAFLVHPFRITAQAEWADAYPTVAGMVRVSDAIVVGTVDGNIGTESGIEDSRSIYTNYKFNVDKWLRGTPSRIGVTIHQMGGSRGLFQMDVPGDPPLASGEHDILFLRQYRPGWFVIVGGPNGRIQDSNGRAQVLSDSNLKIPSGESFDHVVASLTSANAGG